MADVERDRVRDRWNGLIAGGDPHAIEAFKQAELNRVFTRIMVEDDYQERQGSS